MVRASSRAFAVALLAVAVQAPRADAPGRRSAEREGGAPTPIIVELFTSEGCSSCPPADTLLERLVADQPIAAAQIIGLGLHVDYWDHQGWQDRFSSAALTNRQRVYQTRFNTDSIYTPQMVVDGRAEFVGSDATAARRAIHRAASTPHGTLRLAIEPAAPDRLAVSVAASDLPRGTSGPVDVVVAVTEDRLRSEVTRGENHGRQLTHTAVVRYLSSIGEAAATGSTWLRADVPLGRDWQRAHLRVVAFAQERRSRGIVASAAVPVQSAR